MVDWLDPPADPVVTPHKSAKEIALENAAEALGATLGDYYVDPAEVPDKDLARAAKQITPGIRDRIDASREEALLYVARHGARRRRQRRARAALAMLAVVFVFVGVAAGIPLLTDGSVDEAPLPRAGNQEQQSRYWVSPGYRRYGESPAPFGTSVSVTIQQKAEKVVASSFVGMKGSLCSSVVSIRDGISTKNSGDSCLDPSRVNARLSRGGAFFESVFTGKGYTVLQGYAGAEVRSIEAPRRGWGTPIDIALSRPWTPEAPGLKEHTPRVKPLRTFLALAHPDFGDDGKSSDESNCALDYRSYGLKARLANGRTVPVASTSRGFGCKGIRGARSPSQ